MGTNFLNYQFSRKQFSYCDHSNVSPYFKTILLEDVTALGISPKLHLKRWMTQVLLGQPGTQTWIDLLTLMKEKESKEKTVPGLARGWPAPPSFLRGQEVSFSYVMQVSWQGP